MSSVKNPLLSLGARGSVGEALSFTRRRSQNIAEKKPIPRDPQTLAQVYQRWDYQDSIFYWQSLTSAQKQIWRTNASRYHMTGFAYCMSYYLSNLPDLAGRWRLDQVTGGLTPDSSKNNNPGTVLGPSLTRGRIDAALLFDGLDDYVSAPYNPVYDLTDAMTIEAFVNLDTFTAAGIACRHVALVDWVWQLFHHHVGNSFRFNIQVNNVNRQVNSITSYLIKTWYHVCAVYDRVTLRIYINGELDCIPLAENGPIDTAALPLHIGRYQKALYSLKGIIDEVRLSNRALVPAQIKNHSERRYPL